MLLKDGFCDKATHLRMVTSRLQQEYGSTRSELPTWINIMVLILFGLVSVLFRFRTLRFF